MSFIVNPPGGLDPLIFTLNAAVTPVDFTGSSALATVQRKSHIVSISNGPGFDGRAKGIYGPAGWYSFRVEVSVLAAPPYTGDFWEAYVGAFASLNNGEIYATYKDVAYPSDGPPIIVQTHVNPDSFSDNVGNPQNAAPSPLLNAANFRLTTLAAAAGFEFIEVCLCFLGP